jgi:hypothetical protein
MKKITKTVKAPAPARKSTAAPKVKKSAAPSEAPPVVVKPKGAKVTITAKIDIGFGNTLFIRGDGAGLSWETGKALACAEGDTWSVVLSGVEKPLAFKFLVNDETWSAGQNFEAAPGDTVTVTPGF